MAASKNLELAVAVAVAAYVPRPDLTLAARVGPLIKVPVLVGLVFRVKWVLRRQEDGIEGSLPSEVGKIWCLRGGSSQEVHHIVCRYPSICVWLQYTSGHE